MVANILVDERIKAGEKFVRAFNAYYPVSVACWVIPADSDNPYLYVASDEISDQNIELAYGDMVRKLRGSWTSWLDQFRVRLINSTDPIAREAMKIRDLYGTSMPTHYDGTSIGGTGIDGAYIYPSISSLMVAS